MGVEKWVTGWGLCLPASGGSVATRPVTPPPFLYFFYFCARVRTCRGQVGAKRRIPDHVRHVDLDAPAPGQDEGGAAGGKKGGANWWEAGPGRRADTTLVKLPGMRSAGGLAGVDETTAETRGKIRMAEELGSVR